MEKENPQPVSTGPQIDRSLASHTVAEPGSIVPLERNSFANFPAHLPTANTFYFVPNQDAPKWPTQVPQGGGSSAPLGSYAPSIVASDASHDAGLNLPENAGGKRSILPTSNDPQRWDLLYRQVDSIIAKATSSVTDCEEPPKKRLKHSHEEGYSVHAMAQQPTMDAFVDPSASSSGASANMKGGGLIDASGQHAAPSNVDAMAMSRGTGLNGAAGYKIPSVDTTFLKEKLADFDQTDRGMRGGYDASVSQDAQLVNNGNEIQSATAPEVTHNGVDSDLNVNTIGSTYETVPEDGASLNANVNAKKQYDDAFFEALFGVGWNLPNFEEQLWEDKSSPVEAKVNGDVGDASHVLPCMSQTTAAPAVPSVVCKLANPTDAKLPCLAKLYTLEECEEHLIHIHGMASGKARAATQTRYACSWSGCSSIGDQGVTNNSLFRHALKHLVAFKCKYCADNNNPSKHYTTQRFETLRKHVEKVHSNMAPLGDDEKEASVIFVQ